MAFMCYCSQSEGGDENGWMMLTERSALSGSIWPNDLIVSLADKELGRNGAMIKAVNDWKLAEKGLAGQIDEWTAKLHQKDKDVDQMQHPGVLWDAQQEELKIDKPKDSE